MRKGGASIAATAALTGLLLLLGVAGASAQQFGSNLQAIPNAGICKVPEGAGEETSCTYAQLILADGHSAGGGLESGEGGVLTSWRVSSGTASSGTTAVKMRLHLIDPFHEVSLTGGSPYVELPLGQPGVHEFPAQLRVPERMLVGLDVQVNGFPGFASAPLAHSESEVGDVIKWVPSLGEGPFPTPIKGEPNLEFLFNATIERDRDHDGYGDRTQDRCPEDPKRHDNCDRKSPRTHLTYVPRQDFLGSKRVVVFMRSSEAGRVIANGQIEISGGGATWGIYNAQKRVGRGDKVKLVLRVPANAREAAARSFAHGRRVLVKVSAYGIDAVGNESGTTVATIRPKR